MKTEQPAERAASPRTRKQTPRRRRFARTIPHVAHRLSDLLSVHQLRRAIARGEVAVEKFGGRVRIPMREERRLVELLSTE
jgi:hypothetical protein